MCVYIYIYTHTSLVCIRFRCIIKFEELSENGSPDVCLFRSVCEPTTFEQITALATHVKAAPSGSLDLMLVQCLRLGQLRPFKRLV